MKPCDLELAYPGLPVGDDAIPMALACLVLVGPQQQRDQWGWVSIAEVIAWAKAAEGLPGFAWVRLLALIGPNFRGLLSLGLVELEVDGDAASRLRFTSAGLEQLGASTWHRKDDKQT
jgi:hypothetical protein